MDFIAAIEKGLGRTARINLLPMQKGDMRETFADYRLLEALTGYRPTTPIETGIAAFINWRRKFYAGQDGRAAS